MNTSIYSGVSGLLSSQKGLDVESNNISNVNTVSFKSDSISFYDMMYDKSGMGFGTSLDKTKKDFSQGNIQNTGEPYDFTIIGNGFFTVQSQFTPTETAYTRAGNFQRGQDGFLITSVGDYVLGNTPVITTVPKTTVVDNNIYTNFIATGKGTTKTTNYTVNAYSSNYKSQAVDKGNLGVSGDGLKTPQSTISDIEALTLGYQHTLDQNQTSKIDGDDVTYKKDIVKFDLPIKQNENIEITIDGVKYQEVISSDSEQSFKNLADKVSASTGMSASVDYATGIMTLTAIIPGKDFIVNSAKNGFNNAVITTQTEAKGSGQKLIQAYEEKLRATITAIDGNFITSKSEVTIPKSGDIFKNKIQLDLSNPILGISNVSMGDLFQEDGKLYIKQLDANYLVGYVAPVTFINNGGLDPVGDNRYLKTTQSGDPKYIENLAKINSEMLEISNTSLSEGLVDLMVYQKSFEANSKAIATSDELLKTALQLKTK